MQQLLFTCGTGEEGQLGALVQNQQVSMQKHIRVVERLKGENLLACAAGFNHSLALSSAGAVYAFGSNYDGQCGVAEKKEKQVHVRVPTKIEVGNHFVAKLSCGFHHSVLLTSEGDVLTFGEGHFGQLGHGDRGNRRIPQLVEGLSGKGTVSVACGGHHSLFVQPSGAVYACGRGDRGQLGLAFDEKRDLSAVTSPMAVKGFSSAHNASVVVAKGGASHSIFVTASGAASSCGAGLYGRLGLGDERGRFEPTAVPLKHLWNLESSRTLKL